jgi:hypothetical protein
VLSLLSKQVFGLWPVSVHVFLVALVTPNQMMRLYGLQRDMPYVMLHRKESEYGAKVVSAWCYSGVGQIPCREWTFQANWALGSKSDRGVKFVNTNFNHSIYRGDRWFDTQRGCHESKKPILMLQVKEERIEPFLRISISTFGRTAYANGLKASRLHTVPAGKHKDT